MLPFFISIPHSGEKVPAEASWLSGLEEPILMCDVDRFVDDLYRPGIEKLQIPSVVAEWHRYVVDLNRLPDDVDASSVTGHPNAAGKFTTGLLWVKTTTGIQLMPNPISATLHQSLVQKYFEPFHTQVRAQYESFKKLGHKTVYHLDAHSMPSRGTAAHRDPGADRPQIVVQLNSRILLFRLMSVPAFKWPTTGLTKVVVSLKLMASPKRGSMRSKLS